MVGSPNIFGGICVCTDAYMCLFCAQFQENSPHSLIRVFKGECKIHFSNVTASEKSKAAEKQKEKSCRREAGAGAGRGKGGKGTRRKELVALFRGRA